jgi:hypothetical protein
MTNPERRVVTIEGRRTLIVERRPPLPAHLDQLVAELHGGFHNPLRTAGWRPTCEDQAHRLELFAGGFHRGTDGHGRELNLLQCLDCGGVQVRDVSLDRMAGLPTGRLPLRRRNLNLGWYASGRRSQRQYR